MSWMRWAVAVWLGMQGGGVGVADGAAAAREAWREAAGVAAAAAADRIAQEGAAAVPVLAAVMTEIAELAERARGKAGSAAAAASPAAPEVRKKAELMAQEPGPADAAAPAAKEVREKTEVVPREPVPAEPKTAGAARAPEPTSGKPRAAEPKAAAESAAAEPRSAEERAPGAAGAAREAGAGGSGRAAGPSGETLFPFGHGRAIVRCAPLRASAIELEAGEVVLSTSTGDSERWLIQTAAAGREGRTPLVVIKPTACDLSTNLLISTDRRLYEIELDSPPCREADSAERGKGYNPRLSYTGVLRFYYPDELVRRWAREEQLARARAESAAENQTPLAPSARLASLNFDYSWERDRGYPWTPSQVFDDGEHTYIVLPEGAHFAVAPVLFAEQPGGALVLLNYHIENRTYVADRVLAKAVLVGAGGGGRGRNEQRLTITNRRRGRS